MDCAKTVASKKEHFLVFVKTLTRHAELGKFLVLLKKDKCLSSPKLKNSKIADEITLGDKLRARRRELGLTLQNVADKAGLTVGFISQIERNLTAPSLSSLVSVSHVLGTQVSEFLSQPKGDKSITRHDERRVYGFGGSSLSYERLSSNLPDNVLRSVIIHEPPGHRAEPISHEGEEMLFILNGTLTVEIDGMKTVLETGDSIHFPSTTIHSTWNHSENTTAILWVGTMDVFGEDGGDPDPIHKKHPLAKHASKRGI